MGTGPVPPCRQKNVLHYYGIGVRRHFRQTLPASHSRQAAPVHLHAYAAKLTIVQSMNPGRTCSWRIALAHVPGTAAAPSAALEQQLSAVQQPQPPVVELVQIHHHRQPGPAAALAAQHRCRWVARLSLGAPSQTPRAALVGLGSAADRHHACLPLDLPLQCHCHPWAPPLVLAVVLLHLWTCVTKHHTR